MMNPVAQENTIDDLICAVETATLSLSNRVAAGASLGSLLHVADMLEASSAFNEMRDPGHHLVRLRAYERRLGRLERDLAIARLSIARHARCVHNSLALISALPDELLRLVFGYLTDTTAESGAIEVVTRVCSRWRQIALSKSSLWKRLDLSWSSDRFNAWATRSGVQLLNVYFNMDSDDWREDSYLLHWRHIEGTTRRNSKHLPRIETLTVCVRDSRRSAAQRVTDLCQSLLNFPTHSHLRTAIIELYGAHDNARVAGHLFPRFLESLQLSGINVIRPSFTSVRELFLSRQSLPAADWVSLFYSLDHVEEMVLEDVSVEDHRGDEWPSDHDPQASFVFTMRCLEFLCIQYTDSSTFYDLFARRCRMPALKSIVVVETRDVIPAVDMLLDLQAVESMDITLPPTTTNRLLDALSLFTYPQDLSIKWSYHKIRSSLREFITRRVSSPHNDTPDGKALQTLRVINCPSEDQEWLRERVHKLVVQREWTPR